MKTLRRTSSGPEVVNLKANLRKLNFTMTPGDYFDLQTEAGVRTFQELAHLEKDGIVGPKTRAELRKLPQLFMTKVDPINWLKITPYYPQRDNVYKPAGTCNVTALAMVLAYHGIESKNPSDQLEDELFTRLQQPDAIAEFERSYPQLKKQGYKPRHIHGMLQWLARKYGFTSSFSEDVSEDQMATHGRKVGPMILSGRFTSSGHIVCLIGMTRLGDYIVHDPWGDWNTGYRSTQGSYRIYNREAMQDILTGKSRTHKRVHRISPK